MTNFEYSGNELELFRKALNWKKYYASLISPYVKGDVLEVGAGIGSSTVFLNNGKQASWLCLEPDRDAVEKINSRIKSGEIDQSCKCISGNINNLKQEERFDSILYIDVLEHIEDDGSEMNSAVSHLKPEGTIIILVPAHEWLFSDFDSKIGHFRRYNKTTLCSILPKTLKKIWLGYLDSLSVFLSWGNKLILRQNMPTEKQISFWDNNILPLSKTTDRIIRFSFGKSLLGIWKNNE